MASKSFPILLAAIVIALFVSPSVSQPFFAAAEEDPNQYCYGARDQALCTRMVGKDTTIWKDAIFNAIGASIRVVKQLETMIPVVEKSTEELSPAVRYRVKNACAKSFGDSMTGLRSSIDALNRGDMVGVGTRISQSFGTSCTDTLKKEGVRIPILQKLTDHFALVIDAATAVVFQT